MDEPRRAVHIELHLFCFHFPQGRGCHRHGAFDRDVERGRNRTSRGTLNKFKLRCLCHASQNWPDRGGNAFVDQRMRLLKQSIVEPLFVVG